VNGRKKARQRERGRGGKGEEKREGSILKRRSCVNHICSKAPSKIEEKRRRKKPLGNRNRKRKGEGKKKKKGVVMPQLKIQISHCLGGDKLKGGKG